MRKARTQIEHTSKTGSHGKKPSIGRGNVGLSTMNKRKKKNSYKKYFCKYEKQHIYILIYKAGISAYNTCKEDIVFI